jgi:two-component system, chemotaxis family, sensor kinase CheA
MDAVREAVHALAGVLTIQSQPGQGSRFILRLPITVSIINALIVRSGPFEIAFPLNVVARTVELKHCDILEESGRSTIFVENVSVQLHNLRQVLHLPPHAQDEGALQAVVICDVGGSLLAFGADHISGQQEIFVRPLRSPLSKLRGFSGATITSDGRVFFVADASALV